MFRLRSSGGAEDDASWDLAERQYRAHLQRLALDRSGDLWRWFAVDVFHDGQIGRLRFDESMQALRFEVECPNIRRRIGDGFEYVSARFRCEIGGLANFALTARRFDAYNDPLSAKESAVTFIAAEVDTLDAEIQDARAAFGRQFHSLVIQTITGRRFISVVFETITVVPLKPKTFELLSRDPRVIMPWHDGVDERDGT